MGIAFIVFIILLVLGSIPEIIRYRHKRKIEARYRPFKPVDKKCGSK